MRLTWPTLRTALRQRKSRPLNGSALGISMLFIAACFLPQMNAVAQMMPGPPQPPTHNSPDRKTIPLGNTGVEVPIPEIKLKRIIGDRPSRPLRRDSQHEERTHQPSVPENGLQKPTDMERSPQPPPITHESEFKSEQGVRSDGKPPTDTVDSSTDQETSVDVREVEENQPNVPTQSAGPTRRGKLPFQFESIPLSTVPSVPEDVMEAKLPALKRLKASKKLNPPSLLENKPSKATTDVATLKSLTVEDLEQADAAISLAQRKMTAQIAGPGIPITDEFDSGGKSGSDVATSPQQSAEAEAGSELSADGKPLTKGPTRTAKSIESDIQQSALARTADVPHTESGMSSGTKAEPVVHPQTSSPSEETPKEQKVASLPPDSAPTIDEEGALPDHFPSPMDQDALESKEARDYLIQAAPVIEELSLLLLTVPRVALADFDPSDEITTKIPGDVFLKLETIKRALQNLDARAFAMGVNVPLKYTDYHSSLHNSVKEAYQACDSMISYLTERDEGALENVQKHLVNAQQFIEKIRARSGVDQRHATKPPIS